MLLAYFRHILIILLVLAAGASHAQEKFTISGRVTNKNLEPLIGANITIENSTKGTLTDSNGEFELTLPQVSDSIIIQISHVGFRTQQIIINPSVDQKDYFSIQLEESVSVLQQVNVSGERQRSEVSVFKLEPKSIQALPSAFQDFNKVLSTLPGVVSNNELSSAYSVRGGNFDENLVYVNDIPIYRPFLVSNGQQEGLSFINTDLVSNVAFSAGGWQPVYGDKLSSVLNVTYKQPTKFGASANLSLLGWGAHVEGSSANRKISYIAAARHKSSQYLLNTLETQGEYLPKFYDFQGYMTFLVGPKTDPKRTTIDVLASYARNRYLVEPESRETEFGTFTQSFRLFVAFEGRELLEYDTYQGGIKLTHHFEKNWLTKVIASGVAASEREYTDVEGGYRLCDVDKNLGSRTFNDCVTTRGIGTNYDYGRNLLDANIINLENRHEIVLNNKHTLGFGVGISYQYIDDELNEYSFIDSADYVLAESISTIQANNTLESNQYTGYIQSNSQLSDKITATYGVRVNYWDFSREFLISPRAQLSYQPNWVRDVIFKAAIGLYQQPPFYRELRDFSGELNADIKAQKSIHIISGADYNFRWWNRPFKFLGEVYYKKIYDVIPYDVDNVKVRYYANNEAEAFATGLDLRLSGEFIKDTQSWFSLGIMNVRENVADDGRGYIRRPTDQRVNVGIFFQDHLPNNPTFRVNLSLLFGSGLPFGPPNTYTARNSFNGDSYRRVDIGFSKQFFFKNSTSRWVMVTAEMLNLLGTSNPISYTWISDVTNTDIAVPNALSARFLNVRLSVKL